MYWQESILKFEPLSAAIISRWKKSLAAELGGIPAMLWISHALSLLRADPYAWLRQDPSCCTAGQVISGLIYRSQSPTCCTCYGNCGCWQIAVAPGITRQDCQVLFPLDKDVVLSLTWDHWLMENLEKAQGSEAERLLRRIPEIKYRWMNDTQVEFVNATIADFW